MKDSQYPLKESSISRDLKGHTAPEGTVGTRGIVQFFSLRGWHFIMGLIPDKRELYDRGIFSLPGLI